MSDDERISYLAGDDTGGVDASEQPELDELRRLLADPAVWDEPAPDLEDRVVDAIRAEAAGRGPVPSSEPAAPSGDNVVPMQRRRPHRARVFIGALVAAAAIAALVLVVANRNGTNGVKIALGPTELAPGAHGSATVTSEPSGLRIQLNATGLPRRDGGLYYQAWLKNAAGVLVPIGTFHDGEHVTLWAGVALKDFPTLTVTQEQADNQQGSSGKRVLVGTVSG